MPATLDTASATLISAASETPAGIKGGVREIAGPDFAFADCRTVPFPGTPDPTRICLEARLRPCLALRAGLHARRIHTCSASAWRRMRDVVSFFRYAAKDAAGAAESDRRPGPSRGRDGQLAVGPIRESVSQSRLQRGPARPHRVGRPERADRRHAGRLQHAICAARRHCRALRARRGRSALVGRLRGSSVRGLPAWGLLHRCSASKTCPKITETYGGPEFWYSRGTVGIAGTTGKRRPAAARQRPALLPCRDVARRRQRAGSASEHRRRNPNSLANNPNPERDIDRALYVALVDWVVEADAPAAQRLPARQRRHARGGHVRCDGMAEHPECSRTRRRGQCGARLRLRARRIATTTVPGS